MKLKSMLLLAGVLLFSASGFGQNASTDSATTAARQIVLTGDAANPLHQDNIAAMSQFFNPAFQDPSAPRFLLLDREGKVALGIGGYVKAVGMYDVCGAIDDNGFATNEIPVPFDPSLRNRLGADATNSSLFFKLVAPSSRLGRVLVYAQLGFNSSYGVVLKQAYVQIGHVTAGKARTTFADGPAMAPTIEEKSPCGQVSAKQMLVQYATSSFHGFSAAISAEVPSADYTLSAQTEKISQRFPDIPAYVQYAWNKGHSHIRLSGILRELSYRNEVKADNRFATGWGVQLSTIANIAGGLDFFGHYTYGKGISKYVNDLEGGGFDLIPDADNPNKLEAPGAVGLTAGMQYTFHPGLMASASYSRAQLYDCRRLGEDTYRYGQYVVANVFYNPIADLQLGVEYLHGTRTNYSGLSGHANRFMAMVQYNF